MLLWSGKYYNRHDIDDGVDDDNCRGVDGDYDGCGSYDGDDAGVDGDDDGVDGASIVIPLISLVSPRTMMDEVGGGSSDIIQS